MRQRTRIKWNWRIQRVDSACSSVDSVKAAMHNGVIPQPVLSDLQRMCSLGHNVVVVIVVVDLQKRSSPQELIRLPFCYK